MPFSSFQIIMTLNFKSWNIWVLCANLNVSGDGSIFFAVSGAIKHCIAQLAWELASDPA